ncbi:MAG TPA: lytic murein transglycosylase [Solirubrobacteraceae bacterium]|nr:lytic murein transglycosylase [Solirubrobacteraceae bacterium]
MSRRERRLVLVDLDHAALDEHRALVRVLAQPSGHGGDPNDAELLVSRGDAPWLSFPARVWEHDRAGVWHGVFAVPSAVVRRPEFGFALIASGETIELPHPGFQAAVAPAAAAVPAGSFVPPAAVAAPAAAVAAPALTPASVRLGPAGLRTRAAALATLLAVTASSSPALALAGSAASTNPAHASRERIQQLAVFAAERARASAVRRAVRAARTPARSGHPARRSSAARGALNGPATVQVITPGLASSPTRRAKPVSAAACAPPAPRLRPSDRRSPRTPPGPAAANCAALSPTVHRVAAAPSPPAPATKSSPTTASTPPGTTTAPIESAPLGTTTAPTASTPPGTTAGPSPAAPADPAPASTTPTTTTATTPPPPASGGVPLGAGSAPSLSPVPQRLAIRPPRPARSAPQRRSHPQLPVRLPHGTHAATGAVGVGSLGTRSPSGGASTGGIATTPPGFLGPKSWTGTVVANPALEGVLGNLSAQLRDITRPPRFLIPIYMEAARRYGVPWQVLAAINSVETDYGRNLSTSSAGAIGWMQFEPSTWKEWGVAVDGHDVANPYDPRDAIFSAARYLRAAGGDTDINRAIFAYNHAGWYVDMVMARARAIAVAVQPHVQTNPRGIVSTFFDQWRGHWRQQYRGGYLTHYTRLISAANMVSAANFPYAWGGGHEQPARFAPFDCSGTVSYVLQQAGYEVPTTVSGQIPRWHFPAGPGRVTIFYNATHTFMRIGNRYFGTSTSRPGGGAGWISTDKLPAGYLAGFSEVHVPQLGDNAFAPPGHRRAGAELLAGTGGRHTAGGHTAGRRTAGGGTPTQPLPLRLTKLPAYGARMMLAFRGI